MDNQPRQKLREIITTHGKSLCDDPRRCEGLLRDLCGAHTLEMNLLVNAMKQRVAADLLARQPAVPTDMLLARLTARLRDDLGLTDDSAAWAVDSWAIALGVIASPRQGSHKQSPGVRTPSGEVPRDGPSPVASKRGSQPTPVKPPDFVPPTPVEPKGAPVWSFLVGMLPLIIIALIIGLAVRRDERAAGAGLHANRRFGFAVATRSAISVTIRASDLRGMKASG